jgi:hypothetical protein
MHDVLRKGLARALPWRMALMLVAFVALAGLEPLPQARADSWTSVGRDPHGYGRNLSGAFASDSLFSESTSGKRGKGVRVASLGNSGDYYSAPPSAGSVSISYAGAPSGCLPGHLKGVLSELSSYGRVVVSSTHRGHAHNARAGGAKSSYHLSCQAADFRVHGASPGTVMAVLRSHGGGYKHYGGGLYHIDTGPRRTW